MPTSPAGPIPRPILHVALTVSDLEASVAWYSALFGSEPVIEGPMMTGTEHEYRAAIWLTPLLGLHHFANGTPGKFDERRPGLDHLAFGCADLEELQAWADHLDALGIERGEILNEPYGSGLAFRDPDNIALEFFVTAR